MKLSIVIVSWKVKELLSECVESIYRETQNIDFEVFVVDNNSQDGTVEMLKQDFPQVNLIANKTNNGFARANNQAIDKARGEYVLLLNPDTKILDQALEKVVEYMDQTRDCGVCGCNLLNPDRSLQPSVRHFPKLIDQALVLLKLHNFLPNLSCFRRYLARDFDYAKTQKADQVMGAFMMIRRNLIDEIGSLDNGYWIWFEEVDFCRRTVDADFEVRYFADAQIIHHFGQSFKQKMSLEKQKIFNASMRRYFKKHHSKFAYLIIVALQPVSLVLAWLSQIIRKK